MMKAKLAHKQMNRNRRKAIGKEYNWRKLTVESFSKIGDFLMNGPANSSVLDGTFGNGKRIVQHIRYGHGYGRTSLYKQSAVGVR